MKCLRVPAWCSTLHSAKPQQSEESLFAEPVLCALRSENIDQRFALSVSSALAQGYIQVRPAQISVPFRNLVFENELVAEGVPGQVRDNSMVLVPVVARMSKDDVWTEVPGKALELVLDCGELRREIAVAKFMQLDRTLGCGAEEFPSPASGFGRARSGRAPHNPTEFRTRLSPCQLRERSAAANLDVVRVSAETQNPERRFGSLQIQA